MAATERDRQILSPEPPELWVATLGYSPGNTNGVLDTMTQVAISQYEAENGLQITGAPSQGLLDALTNSVANQ